MYPLGMKYFLLCQPFEKGCKLTIPEAFGKNVHAGKLIHVFLLDKYVHDDVNV